MNTPPSTATTPELTHMATKSVSFSCDVLEFRAALELLRGYLSGPLAEPRLEKLRPETRLDNIKRDLNRAAEALEALSGNGRPALNSLKDPRPILERLRVEALTLTAQEILALLANVEKGVLFERARLLRVLGFELGDLLRQRVVESRRWK